MNYYIQATKNIITVHLGINATLHYEGRLGIIRGMHKLDRNITIYNYMEGWHIQIPIHPRYITIHNLGALIITEGWHTQIPIHPISPLRCCCWHGVDQRSKKSPLRSGYDYCFHLQINKPISAKWSKFKFHLRRWWLFSFSFLRSDLLPSSRLRWCRLLCFLLPSLDRCFVIEDAPSFDFCLSAPRSTAPIASAICCW